jgi:hypothetical protein
MKTAKEPDGNTKMATATLPTEERILLENVVDSKKGGKCISAKTEIEQETRKWPRSLMGMADLKMIAANPALCSLTPRQHEISPVRWLR